VDCAAYSGSIGIWFGPDIADIPPQVLKGHLSRLGLSGITHISEDFLLMLPPDVAEASPLVLSLFEDLTYIGGALTVDVNTNGILGMQISRHFDLSSLQKVSHVGGNLNIRNTRLNDLSIFNALTCVGHEHGRKKALSAACSSSSCHTNGQLALSGNPVMASYNGLQSLRSVTRSIIDTDGAALVDLSALAQLGHCKAGSQVSTRVRFNVVACPHDTLTTWAHVCSYISSKKCPHEPTDPPFPPPIPQSSPFSNPPPQPVPFLAPRLPRPGHSPPPLAPPLASPPTYLKPISPPSQRPGPKPWWPPSFPPPPTAAVPGSPTLQQPTLPPPPFIRGASTPPYREPTPPFPPPPAVCPLLELPEDDPDGKIVESLAHVDLMGFSSLPRVCLRLRSCLTSGNQGLTSQGQGNAPRTSKAPLPTDKAARTSISNAPPEEAWRKKCSLLQNL
jgi:hypothetical protein